MSSRKISFNIHCWWWPPSKRQTTNDPSAARLKSDTQNKTPDRSSWGIILWKCCESASPQPHLFASGTSLTGIATAPEDTVAMARVPAPPNQPTKVGTLPGIVSAASVLEIFFPGPENGKWNQALSLFFGVTQRCDRRERSREGKCVRLGSADLTHRGRADPTAIFSVDGAWSNGLQKTKRERAESGDVFKNYVCASKKESVLHRTYSTHLHTLRKKTPAGNRFWMVSMSAWLAPSSPLSCPAI